MYFISILVNVMDVSPLMSISAAGLYAGRSTALLTCNVRPYVRRTRVLYEYVTMTLCMLYRLIEPSHASTQTRNGSLEPVPGTCPVSGQRRVSVWRLSGMCMPCSVLPSMHALLGSLLGPLVTTFVWHPPRRGPPPACTLLSETGSAVAPNKCVVTHTAALFTCACP